MYSNKIKFSQREKPDTGAYTILYGEFPRNSWKLKDFITVLSIDPATNNTGIRIERWNFSTGVIKMIKFFRVSFKDDDPEDTNYVFQRCLDYIKGLKEFISKCDIVISERQLPENYKAVRISTVILSYVMSILDEEAVVIEVMPQLKGKQLGAPKGISSRDLKKWSVEKAPEILAERGDEASIKILNKEKKKDDLADTVCQVEAFFKLVDMKGFMNKPCQAKLVIKKDTNK